MKEYEITYQTTFLVSGEDEEEARQQSDERFIEHWKEGGSFDEMFRIKVRKRK